MRLWLQLLLLCSAVFADEGELISACLAKNGGKGGLDVWISCIESARFQQSDEATEPATGECLMLPDDSVPETADETQVNTDLSELVAACLAENGNGDRDLDAWISCIESAKLQTTQQDSDELEPTTDEAVALVDRAEANEEAEARSSLVDAELVAACVAENGNGDLDVWISCIESTKRQALLDHDHVQSNTGEALVLVETTTTTDQGKPLRTIAIVLACVLLISLLVIVAQTARDQRGARKKRRASSKASPKPLSKELQSICRQLGFAFANILHELMRDKQFGPSDEDLKELLECCIRPGLFEGIGDQSPVFTKSLIHSIEKHYQTLATLHEKTRSFMAEQRRLERQ